MCIGDGHPEANADVADRFGDLPGTTQFQMEIFLISDADYVAIREPSRGMVQLNGPGLCHHFLQYFYYRVGGAAGADPAANGKSSSLLDGQMPKQQKYPQR